MSQRTRLTLIVVSLGAILAAQALVFAQVVSAGAASDYDEGTYLASVDALRHGQRLGAAVFASQPPDWYQLLELLSLLTTRSVEAWRVWMVVIALLGTIAAFEVVRRLAGAVAGLIAAGLLGISPYYGDYAARVVADVPAISFTFAALAFAVAACRPRRWIPALAAGALFVCAVLIKLTALTAVIPLIGLAIALRPRRGEVGAFAAGAAAVGLAAVVANARALGSLWAGAVTYHRLAARLTVVPNAGANRFRLREAYVHDGRTLFFWFVVAGVAALIALVALRRAGLVWPLWLWPVVVAPVLVETRPLHENHYTLLSASLVLPVGASLGALLDGLRSVRLRAASLVIIAMALTIGYVRTGRRLATASDHERDGPAVAWGVGRLRHGSGLVVTDQPILAYLAGRRVPGELVDTAVLRFDTGSLTDEMVLHVIDRDHVSVVTVGRAFRDRPAILEGLRERYARRSTRYGVTAFFDRRSS